MGDFNNILDKEEKEGGNIRTKGSLDYFRDFVKSSGVLDLGYVGYPFTWWNKREGSLGGKRGLRGSHQGHME
ncbi:hypothetical protein LIER_34166 [Lithospermum erythrorhizon]|uniref:Endonuclease/exonuclease/phosphatase n=1 Tax=Lithospermum erythrorhizon TaxID=34254 RepID=A0AAV3S0L8_LITER